MKPPSQLPSSTRNGTTPDLVTVVVFLLAPFFFGLGGYVAAVAWGLAVVHLLMTLLTRFPLGLVKLIPFPIHGAVELVVGVVLVLAMPRMLGAGPGSPARTFFVGAGVAILVVWVLTRYRKSPSISAEASSGRS